jgi:uroporphyrinogen III methyltransferase / synthase
VTQSSAPRHGIVYLVGAGPGDPGLITLRGVECLRRADLVLYDSLVNPAVVGTASDSAELICLGHHGEQLRGERQKVWSQDEINAAMIHASREGKTVVRLKGGDPDVFGRSVDEMEALAAAGVRYETVPGVTAALAAAGYAAIPITHGRYASALALVTGHQRHDKPWPGLDYGALADFPGTLVFYMGVTSAGQWSEALVRRGKSPNTPVAIVRRCTWSDQQTIRCTLGTVADVIAGRRLRPPAVIIVGDVVALAPENSWFAARPLFGKRVLVTRPRHQAERLHEKLRELGADVVLQPAIEISPPLEWGAVDEVLGRVNQYHWIVFSSANGVRFFLDRLWQRLGDWRRLAGARLAAIGPGTAEELLKYRLRADLVPDQYRAESLAEALGSQSRGQRLLLIRASRGREVLAERLAAAGGQVEQVVAYRSHDVQTPDADVAAALADGRIDWVTVTSSAIAHSLVRMFGEGLRRARLASISPITSETLSREGFPPLVEAARYTMDGVVEAILAHEASRKSVDS